MNQEQILESIGRFPRSPGVYIMRDSKGGPLYIGKAQNIRNRVKSYFLDSREERAQIPAMLNRLHHIDWIATNNETEALILEANLIRKHKPPYNLDLKDDKHYPYIKVTVQEAFPRLLVSRKILDDGALYFGPYTDARAMRKIMSFARKAFKIRSCNRRFPLKRPVRPCLNHSIARCPGVCAGNITESEYRGGVTLALQFLRGRKTDIIGELKRLMREASDRLDYETAASIRDQIFLVQDSPHMQQVDVREIDAKTDVFGFHKSGRHTCLCALSFREGVLLSKRHYLFDSRMWELSHGSRESLITQFYQETSGDPPSEILLPPSEEFNAGLLEVWFTKNFNRTVKVATPRKGKRLYLVNLAEKNALLHMSQKIRPDSRHDLEELASALRLPEIPRTIEAFDISNIGGSFAVAGMVCFRDGAPDKSQYRRYKIRTVDGQNDFAMIMEAVSRRITRLHRENRPFPDLLIIDGGKGQLQAAIRPLSEFEKKPMVVSIAKKEELIFSPWSKHPVRLPESHAGRRLVQRIRDEAHRWAVSYHRKLRDSRLKKSSLQNIPGLGPSKSAALLKHFGSIKRLKNASVSEISKVKGFSNTLAELVKRNLL